MPGAELSSAERSRQGVGPRVVDEPRRSKSITSLASLSKNGIALPSSRAWLASRAISRPAAAGDAAVALEGDASVARWVLP